MSTTPVISDGVVRELCMLDEVAEVGKKLRGFLAGFDAILVGRIVPAGIGYQTNA